MPSVHGGGLLIVRNPTLAEVLLRSSATPEANLLVRAGQTLCGRALSARKEALCPFSIHAADLAQGWHKQSLDAGLGTQKRPFR
jgi:hypothetical protein